jgi:hypothetical protein
MLVIGIRSSSIGMKHEIVTSREIKSEKIGSPPKKCEIRRGEYMCAYFLNAISEGDKQTYGNSHYDTIKRLTLTKTKCFDGIRS